MPAQDSTALGSDVGCASCRGYYTLLAWLPSYFELSLGLNVESSSLLTLIPYLAMTAMTPFVGPIADGLVSKGWSVTNVRKLAQVCPSTPVLCDSESLRGGLRKQGHLDSLSSC